MSEHYMVECSAIEGPLQHACMLLFSLFLFLPPHFTIIPSTFVTPHAVLFIIQSSRLKTQPGLQRKDDCVGPLSPAQTTLLSLTIMVGSPDVSSESCPL